MSLQKQRKVPKFFRSDRKKKKNIDKDGNESVSTISYKIKCIDSVRFISSSQSNLADNFAERIDKVICKDFDIFLNLIVPRTIR